MEMRIVVNRLVRHVRSRRFWLVRTAGWVVLALALVAVATRYFAETTWPIFRAHPGVLVAAGALSLLGYVFKAYGWRLLFAAKERPQPLALAAANGGASITALVLPGRFDDVVRIAIVRRFRNCPASVQSLCLSLGMLGLIDSATLAPLAFAAAAHPGHPIGVRLGLVVLGVVGLAAAALVFALPRLAGGRQLLRFRFGRWLSPRTTSLADASLAGAFVLAGWATRAAGLVVLLGALGVEYSVSLALLYLCASSAASVLPVGPGGTAVQAGAGAAVLIASGVGTSEAVGVAVAVQLVGIVIGGSILLVATAWRTGLRLAAGSRAAPAGARPA